MNRQLEAWQGDFGKAYTDRNVVDWRTRLDAFQEMLKGLPIERALEVGCNRGHNLTALVRGLGETSEVVGVEPCGYALEQARRANPGLELVQAHGLDLPFEDGYFDLVSTCTVLIHVVLADLPEALGEIHRVSRRYILTIEYFAEAETVIHYRSHDDLLWKRDFLRHYQAQFPELRLARHGYWGPEDGFDRCHWWLLEKPPATPTGSEPR